MKYVGKFNNVNNVEVKVTIITNNDSSQTTEITLADEPIVIETDSDGVFSPIKSRTCTIRMLSDLVYFDMYSATAKGVSVEVKESASTIFLGYMTPNIYNLDFIGKDVIELEAVEAVSILKWYDYLNVSQNGVASLYDVLKYFLYTICGYTKLLVPKELKLTSTSTADILNNIKILEKNFEEDDGDLLLNITTGKYEYKADKIKCYEVLEEICKFLNMTFTAEGKYAAIQSYPYIAAGNTKIWEYKFSNNDVDNENYTSSYVITDASFEDADTTISLTETYNRVNVEVDTYEIESEDLCPSVFDNVESWTGVTHPTGGYRTCTFVIDGADYYFYYIPYFNKKWKTYNYGACGGESVIPNREWFYQYSQTSGFTYGMYLLDTTLPNMVGRENAEWYYLGKMIGMEGDGLYLIIGSPVWNDENYIKRYLQIGATIIRLWEWDLKTVIPATANWNEYLQFCLGLPRCIVQSCSNTSIKRNDSIGTYWGNTVQTVELQLGVLNQYHKNNDVCLAEFTEGVYAVYGSATEDTYFVINGSVQYEMFWLYPTEECKDSNKDYTKEWVCIEGLNELWKYPTLLMQIQIGNYYYKGNGLFDSNGYYHDDGEYAGVWTTTPSKFYVTAAKDKNLVYNEWMPIYNTVEYTYGIDKSGYCIKIPSGTVLKGDLKIRFYCPYLYHYGKNDSASQSYVGTLSYRSVARWCSLKDFSIDYCTKQGDWFNVDDEKEDYSYYNVINDNYVLEAESILLKINTLRDGFKPSYSSVLDANGNYLTLLYSKSLNKTQKQEYNIIETLVNHFNSPKKLLEITLPRPLYLSSIVTYPSLFGNTKFVVDSLREDLKNNTTTVNLIEL